MHTFQSGSLSTVTLQRHTLRLRTAFFFFYSVCVRFHCVLPVGCALASLQYTFTPGSASQVDHLVDPLACYFLSDLVRRTGIQKCPRNRLMPKSTGLPSVAMVKTDSSRRRHNLQQHHTQHSLRENKDLLWGLWLPRGFLAQCQAQFTCQRSRFSKVYSPPQLPPSMRPCRCLWLSLQSV